MPRTKRDDKVRAPLSLRDEVEQINGLTDGFCQEYLDVEYAGLCRKLVGAIARRRPSPLERGDLRVWSAGVLYTVGRINFLFDRSQKPHLTGDQLSSLTGVPKSTMSAKSKVICDRLRLRDHDPEYCRREFLVSHPFAWLVEIGGLIVDARTLPPEVQQGLRQRGLIPDIS